MLEEDAVPLTLTEQVLSVSLKRHPPCKASEVVVVGKAKGAEEEKGAKGDGGVAAEDEEEGTGGKGQVLVQWRSWRPHWRN